TRRNRPNYFLLNDGLDEEVSSEDRLDSYENVTTLENDILPLESASQIRQPLSESLVESQEPLRNARISEPKSTKWPWTYFEISEFENPWIVKKSNKRNNMIDHLRKQHSINFPDKPEEPKNAEYSILSFIKGKERLTHQQLLEKNILSWIVAEKQPFTTLESPAFQQIFHDIPGIRLPFTSRQVVRQRLADQF
ncbi:uncharacterized protein V1513DRAFT_363786, partial [Lipomyces chichibuensis]|uniref:uncharacterized protein n=1 Tax=Lipomyces chichibuensis TaxID=1546026 RepID=UPI003343C23B